MRLLRRITWWLRSSSNEAELADELAHHRAMVERDLVAAGHSPEDARYAARRAMGNETFMREESRGVWFGLGSGPRRADPMSVLTDVRYAARFLRRRPLVSLAAILTIALGIGGNAAVFSVADALMLRELAVPSPGRLARLADATRENPDLFSFAAYERIRDAARGSAALIAISEVYAGGLPIEDRGRTHDASVQFVTENYFDVLGVRMGRGSPFHRPGDRVAVISDGYWRRHFGASDDAIGSHIQYQQVDYVVSGITAPEFRGTNLDRPTEVWLPFDAVVPPGDDARTRGRWMLVMARLRSEATLQQIAQQASAVLGRAVSAEPGNVGYSALRSRLFRPLMLVELVVVLVLLIVGANLANLMLSMLSARRLELAVRRAIGASRLRVVRQLVTEGLMLALAGSALGLVVAYAGHAALLRFLPADQSPALANLRFTFDARLIAFALSLACLICVLFALIPALLSTDGDGVAQMRAGSSAGSVGQQWFRRALLVAQVAMCALMLLAGGTFLRSAHQLRTQHAGYREDGILVADVRFPRAYRETQRDALIETLRSRIAKLPGVQVAAFSNFGQLSGASLGFRVSSPGGPVVDSASSYASALRISPAFFAAMGTELVAGRDFTPADDERTPAVAIVNREFARRFLAPGNPIGQRFVQQRRPGLTTILEVVGVAENVKWESLREKSGPMFYLPYSQVGGAPVVRLAIRTSGDVNALGGALVREAEAIDVNMGLRNVGPFSVVVDGTLTVERLVSQVATVLGVIALIIAAVGLYAVLANQVMQRRREIAIRMALGARTAAVERMVLGESAILLAAGCAVGIPLGIATTRAGASLLFGVGAVDPVTIAAVVLVLAVATFLASSGPARRAAQTDPALVLRE